MRATSPFLACIATPISVQTSSYSNLYRLDPRVLVCSCRCQLDSGTSHRPTPFACNAKTDQQWLAGRVMPGIDRVQLLMRGKLVRLFMRKLPCSLSASSAAVDRRCSPVLARSP
ncbi:hypothetical protein L798_08570 [Zootermopsis nevadensis]|uniref:Uncharacterized protein n=1 Tax=Zootermopsis nevadensis TaxID=136037 RepID=A0A067R395_ZOONE|nr:hypothetical protein L798_08570 [Zootermopsis nevadensis]